MENTTTSTKLSSGTGEDAQTVHAAVMIPLMASWSVMGAISTVLNVLVCVIVWYNKRLRTITNTFVVSLSVADLLVAAVFIPIYTYEEFSRSKAPISGYLIAFLLLASIFNLCAVTYERYVALTRPFAYRAVMSRRKITTVIGLAWVLPLIIAILPLAWQADPTTLYHKVYLFFTVFGCVLLPCLVMVYVYIRLLRVVRRFIRRNRKRSSYGNRTGERAGNEEKAARVFALIFAMFLLCWLPLIYINVCQTLEMYELITAPVLYVSFFTLVFNTILDPFIYAFLKKDFRKSIQKKIGKGCSKRDDHNTELTTVTGRQTKTGTVTVVYV